MIVAVNGRFATSVDDLHRLMSACDHQQALTVTIIRDRSARDIEVTPELPQ